MQGLRALVGCIVIAALACEADRRQQGETCAYNDDCVDPLVCAARRCRAACRDARDCVAGWRCAPTPTDGRAVCVPPEHPDFCAYHSECAAPRVCGFDGVCRVQCREARDCADFSASLRCDLDAGLCRWPEETAGP